MKYFFEPINLSEWYIFKKVCSFGHEESFYATKEMQIGDMLFLYVTKKNDDEVPGGIYGNGIVVSSPDKNNPENRLRVYIKIKYIRFDEPILNYDVCKQYIKQFRDIHRIDDSIVVELMKTPLMNIMI